jgi:hypothetical protein
MLGFRSDRSSLQKDPLWWKAERLLSVTNPDNRTFIYCGAASLSVDVNDLQPFYLYEKHCESSLY